MIAEMIDAFSWKGFFLANDSQLRDDLVQLWVCCPYYLCSLMFFVLLQTYIRILLLLSSITHTITMNVTMPCYAKSSNLIIVLHYCCFHKLIYVASGSNIITTDWGNWFKTMPSIVFLNG